MRSISYKLFNVLIAVTLLPFIYACSSSDSDNITPISADATWSTSSTVKASSGFSAIALSGPIGLKWSATIIEGEAWCSFGANGTVTSTSGVIKDGLNILYVYYPANTANAQRIANISIQFGDQDNKALSLTQLSASEENLPAFSIWAEMPVYKENSNYQYVTHYVPLNNKTVRNYSICFDKTKKAALWVAYPIHTAYLKGSGKREDPWSFDPYIASQFQANCVTRSYGGSYDRGHQIGSADRLGNQEMNDQTFYMTNMTPQLNRLNQDMWANLEIKVRNNNCSDTLYVVTGAFFGAGALSTKDGAGNAVPIPTNYFKVLLRTKSGNTGKNIKNCSDNELISIGFWVEQKSYGNIQPPASICTSVADIESKTGFKFFPQVSDNVKSQKDPYQWGIN